MSGYLAELAEIRSAYDRNGYSIQIVRRLYKLADRARHDGERKAADAISRCADTIQAAGTKKASA